MRVGFMNDPWKNVLDEIWWVGENRFGYLELGVEGPNATPEILLRDEKKILDALSSYNLKVLTAHSPWYLSFGHPYESIRKAVVKEAVKAVEAAARFQAGKMTVHPEPFYFIQKERKALLQAVFSSFKEVYDACLENGIAFCIENCGEDALSLKELKEFLEKLPEARVTLDIGHANLNKPKSEGVFEALRDFRKKIAHVHAHDNKGKTDDHLPIGAGRIPWESVLARLKEFYDGTITLEDHSADRSLLLHSRETIEKLWKSA